MFDLYTTDSHGYITNGEDTYRCAALDVVSRGHLVLNWTGRDGTVLNILLSYSPARFGTPGGVVDDQPGKLWVGVAGHGCFGFAVRQGFLHPDYIAEKLKVRGTTALNVALLLDKVRNNIAADKATA